MTPREENLEIRVFIAVVVIVSVSLRFGFGVPEWLEWCFIAACCIIWTLLCYSDYIETRWRHRDK